MFTLTSSGETKTPTPAFNHASTLVRHVREKIPDASYKAKIWPYRFSGTAYLCVDVEGVLTGETYPITLRIADEMNLGSIDEPAFEDMADALHYAGILTQGLEAALSLGLDQLEINADITEKSAFRQRKKAG